jgi:DNA repair exonuclease SbcCD ATPase subunit
MKLAYVQMCGFRGFRKETRIDWPSGFAVIAGPNGAGKSTLCDAVEFVLTGGIRSSSDHKEKGESIRQYLWWRGTAPPNNPHVEVGFITFEGTLVIARRTPAGLAVTPHRDLARLLVAEEQALEEPLAQLCRTAILRDEEITALSVDLRETDRFEFVRAAIGAADFRTAQETAKRVSELLSRQLDLAQREYQRQRDRLALLATRLSQLKAQASRSEGLLDAEAALKRHVPSAAGLSDLLARAGREIAILRNRIDGQKRSYARMADIFGRLNQVSTEQYRRSIDEITATLADMERQSEEAAKRAADANSRLKELQSESPRNVSLAQLLEHGRRVGLQNGRCPLCGIAQEETHFKQHLESLEAALNKSNAEIAALSRSAAEAARDELEINARLERLRADLNRLTGSEVALRNEFAEAAGELAPLGFKAADAPGDTLSQLAETINSLVLEANEAENALAILAASQAESQIVNAEREAAAAREQLGSSEKVLSQIGRAQADAREATHTIQRVQGELVDEQLAALSPLLVELYERLRPHVDWRKVRYILRGDVRRMLSLEVGTGLNPSFVFSSGQRRAAGLAFLLAIFLSRSWCKLRTLVLDDPVQHVDDYRALHVTEVLAAIRRGGYQIICTVEDWALAELLARRLRSEYEDHGALIQLTYEAGRGSRVEQVRSLPPLSQRVLVAS